jgi:hypothetical protein
VRQPLKTPQKSVLFFYIENRSSLFAVENAFPSEKSHTTRAEYPDYERMWSFGARMGVGRAAIFLAMVERPKPVDSAHKPALHIATS